MMSMQAAANIMATMVWFMMFPPPPPPPPAPVTNVKTTAV